MKSVAAVLLGALLVSMGVAGHSAHYNMSPVSRFSPQAGDEANFIGFSNGYRIDTRVGEPALPEGMKIDESFADVLYYIIQFSGPINRSWFRQLDRLGVTAVCYLPYYAVLGRMDPVQREKVKALPMVNWVGLFQPAYKVEQELTNRPGLKDITVLVMPGENAGEVTARVDQDGGIVHAVMKSGYGTTVSATLDAADIPAVARLPEVLWMQERTEPSTANDNCQWVVQTGWRASAPLPTDTLARYVWTKGVRGQGIVLSTTDTGLNTGHDMFRDPGMPVTPPGIWPEHRKVVAYKRYGTADATEGQYHGSHVNGTVAGSDSAAGGTSYYDGMSIDGRIYFVDLSNGTSFVLGEDLWTLWDTVYAGRGLPDSLRPIRQHSGSWRWSNSAGTYKLMDASTDAFCWEFKDFLNIMAAGNERSTMRIGNPSLAKNVLTVGATQNGILANQIASFSSRGPSQDNRIKPNVCAPGVDLWSAQRTGQSGYSEMSGTSMATPATNGAVGLMRCYLEQGFYPTGEAVPGNELGYISSALMRAMAMVSTDPNIGSYVVPSFDMGWGRVDADSVLYFAGEDRRLLLMDDTTGIATGESKEMKFRVNSSIPLRVCLAWTDTAAAPNANPTLVNDLNLELIAPAGTEYRGNKYSSGQSEPNPGTWDAVNVEECARVNAPDTGLWTIWVGAQNVATEAKQPFAWVITGDVEFVSFGHDVGVRALVAPVGIVDSGSVVMPTAVVENYGNSPETLDVQFSIDALYGDTVTVFLDVGEADTVSFSTWIAEPIGYHEARCVTRLGTDENPANDFAADSFEVQPQSGIEGGDHLPRVFALENIRPNPFGSRVAVRYAMPRPTSVTVAVYSAAGQLVRTLETGIQRAGYHTATWNGLAEDGARTSRGIYYVRMTTDEFTGVKKLVKVQ